MLKDNVLYILKEGTSECGMKLVLLGPMRMFVGPGPMRFLVGPDWIGWEIWTDQTHGRSVNDWFIREEKVEYT